MSTHIHVLHRTSKLSPMVGYETYKEGGVTQTISQEKRERQLSATVSQPLSASTQPRHPAITTNLYLSTAAAPPPHNTRYHGYHREYLGVFAGGIEGSLGSCS